MAVVAPPEISGVATTVPHSRAGGRPTRRSDGADASRASLDLTDSAVTAMAAMHAESRTGARKPAHKYTLEEFGLTKERVDERFGR